MHCPRCSFQLPAEARYCPLCGEDLARAAERSKPVDRSITAPGIRPGAWWWLLGLLLLAERAVAWWAFPLEDAQRSVGAWERPFLLGWGIGLGLLAVPALAARRRFGGWLALLSGLALTVRSCVPLLAERPAGEAVVGLMVASATLTFAFLYEQSWWPRNPGPDEGGGEDGEAE